MNTIRKNVGVLGESYIGLSYLKQLYLYFDQIYFPFPLTLKKRNEVTQQFENEDIKQFFFEYDFLIEKEIISFPKFSNEKVDYKKYPWLKSLLDSSSLTLYEAASMIPQYLNFEDLEIETKLNIINKIDLALYNVKEIQARLVSSDLKNKGVESFPIISLKNEFLPIKGLNKSEVLNIVIRNLPIPEDTISWEQIFDFKNDPATRNNFLRLRNWINDISKYNLSISEIQDKIEYLISEYNHHMKIHKIRIKFSTLETNIALPFDIIENLVKLKFGKFVKLLISFKHRKVELMDAELKSPSREISYLIQTKQKFGK